MFNEKLTIDNEKSEQTQNPKPETPNPKPKTQNSKFKIQNSKFDLYLWLTILLSLPLIGPLLQPGYFWGAHDARHSVYYLHQFNKAIQDGVWYPRWAPDFAFGYGYPFFNIYGPLSSYVGEIFHLLGFDIVTSVKIVFGLSIVLSGLTMYLFVRRLLGPPAGLIAALTYVYVPYHIFDLYVRAALAESVGFIFVPLTMWAFYEVAIRPSLRAILWGSLAYAALMFTSNLLALMFTPILGLYVAYMLLWQFISEWRMTNDESLRITHYALRFVQTGLPAFFVLLLGLSLSAIFWIPALTEYSFVRVDQWVGGRFAFGDDFVEIFQLFSPKWGFGASIPGPDDAAGFQIGLAAMILFIFSFLIVPKLSDRQVRRTLYFFQGMTLILIFLTTPASYIVWAVLPLSSFAQFPWRLLVIIAPFISVAAGTILNNEQLTMNNEQNKQLQNSELKTLNPKPETQKPSPIPSPHSPFSIFHFSFSTIILASLILLSSYPYIQADVRDPKPTEGPVSQAALFRFQQSSDEMTGQTAWVQRIPNWSTLAEQVERGGQITTKVNYTALPDDNSVGVYSMEMDSIHELLWVGTEKEGQSVTFFVPYYPGWQAYIYEDLGPHDGNLDKEKGPVTRVGPIVDQPQISTTPVEGWMVVPIPTGSHFLELRFEDTPVRVIGFWVSLVSMLVWVGLFVLAKRLL